MKVRQLMTVIASALMVLVGFNAVVARFAKSRGEMIVRAMPVGQTFDLVFLGNSTMDRGFDPAAYASASPSKAYKLAMGGVSAQEECLLLEEFFARGNRARRVVLGFHDLHLEGLKLSKWSDLTGPTNVGYFVNAERMHTIYGLDWAEAIKVALSRQVPMLVRRSNLWARVEMLRRSLSVIGMPPRSAEESERSFYPYLETERESVHALMATLCRGDLSLVMQRMIKGCSATGAELVVTEMPLLPSRVKLCTGDARWQQYRETRAAQLSRSGALYLRGFEWSGNEGDFEDPVHMTPDMAARFSKHLALILATQPLAPSL
jgi:hypothetical protein